ncbi:MAG: hypothetical protein JNM31_15390 [Flavobacteriales bacterium]|nr:hypothetical protein [Flavobacteriales bacterium]
MRPLHRFLMPALFCSCTTAVQVRENPAANGAALSRIEHSEGRKQGEAVIFHTNGREAKRGAYHRDLKEGTWHEWAPDGQPTALLNYHHGRLHGHCRWMAPNGQVLSDERFVDGLLDGRVRRYFPDGRMRQELTYRKGKAEGAYWRHMEAHEDTNAGPIITGHYQDGLSHGQWRGFTGDGRMTSEGSFVRGLRVGIWRHWDRSGRLLREDVFNADGQLVESRHMKE